MNLESLSAASGGAEKLLSQVDEMPTKSLDIKRLDISILLTQETRHELPPMSEGTRERLMEAGWSEVVIDAIGSEAEASVYDEADIKAKDVNGKPALVRTDINYDQTDVFGQTNLERMQNGRAPLDAENRPIELHHIGQTRDAPLAELTRDEHRGSGNDNILHNKRQESEIDRDGFGREREDHWKARAAEIEAGK
jgi:hypothetical protein